MNMTMKDRINLALDSLRNTLADIREYVNTLRNDRKRHYDPEYVAFLKEKYRSRKEYCTDLKRMYKGHEDEPDVNFGY